MRRAPSRAPPTATRSPPRTRTSPTRCASTSAASKRSTRRRPLSPGISSSAKKLAAAQNDGQSPPKKSEYDLTPDDWKQLAQEGKVVSRTPCADPSAWTPTPAQLSKAGLAPSDAQAIHDARAAAYDRVWSVIRPLCVQALQGDAKVADRLGPVTCSSLVGDIAQANGENTGEELRAVAEMRAGMRPYDASVLGTYGQIVYAQSGEPQGMLQQLAQAIGPATRARSSSTPRVAGVTARCPSARARCCRRSDRPLPAHHLHHDHGEQDP